MPESPSRDLSKYEKAGPFDLTLRPKDRARTGASIRDWIWRQWQQKRLAYLVLNAQSIEGELSKSWYFIEPNQAGTWRIWVKIRREATDRRGSGQTWIETVEFEVVAIERVEPRATGLVPYKSIAGSEDLPPEQYRLVLKDGKGNVLQEL